jgi:hypothetical protein
MSHACFACVAIVTSVFCVRLLFYIVGVPCRRTACVLVWRILDGDENLTCFQVLQGVPAEHRLW